MLDPNQKKEPELSPSVDPKARLIELLKSPEPKNKDWQEEAGRMTSLLLVRFQSEPDDVAALRILGLVTLAKSKRVRVATKGAMRLARWRDSPPPPLQSLHNVEEQKSVLAEFRKIGFPWAVDYAKSAVLDPQTTSVIVPAVIGWVQSVTASSDVFISEFCLPVFSSTKSVDDALELMKAVSKDLKISGMEQPQRLATGVAELGDVIRSLVAERNTDKKKSISIATLWLRLLNDAWRVCPSLLMQNQFIRSLGAAVNMVNSLKKPQKSMLDDAASATLSLVLEELRRHGTAAAELLEPLRPVWVDTYEGFGKKLDTVLVKQPELGALFTKTHKDGVIDDSKKYGAEAAFSRLLPAWDVYLESLADSTTCDSLSMMISRAANSNGIEASGKVGQQLAYDPVCHDLASSSDSQPSKVEIIRRGFFVRRPDGSVRTLIKAFVRPV